VVDVCKCDVCKCAESIVHKNQLKKSYHNYVTTVSIRIKTKDNRCNNKYIYIYIYSQPAGKLWQLRQVQ